MGFRIYLSSLFSWPTEDIPIDLKIDEAEAEIQ